MAPLERPVQSRRRPLGGDPSAATRARQPRSIGCAGDHTSRQRPGPALAWPVRLRGEVRRRGAHRPRDRRDPVQPAAARRVRRGALGAVGHRREDDLDLGRHHLQLARQPVLDVPPPSPAQLPPRVRRVRPDNISTNVVGLALGTAFRFVLYRYWVFGHHRSDGLSNLARVEEAQRSIFEEPERRPSDAPATRASDAPPATHGSDAPATPPGLRATPPRPPGSAGTRAGTPPRGS
ncbi:MAG: GtrA family protein [Agromyces sp.]|nr:GtrA family protein [Agromyces sp.]